MLLKYPKISAEEDAKRGVVDPGTYTFLVDSCQSQRTKNGKYEMLVVQLEIYLMDGKAHKMKDWVVMMDEMAWKLRHFANSCGLLDKYESETLDENDFRSRQGFVKIGIKDSVNQSGEVKKVNYVIDYLDAQVEVTGNNRGDGDMPFDDKLPF